MDSTGKAFDESTAANTRLVQQLKEKDEANFKLMTEVHSFVKLSSSKRLFTAYSLQPATKQAAAGVRDAQTDDERHASRAGGDKSGGEAWH